MVWRLGRSIRDLLQLVDRLDKSDINFISLKEKFDTSTIAGLSSARARGAGEVVGVGRLASRFKVGDLPDRASLWATVLHVSPQMLRGGLNIFRKSRLKSIRTGIVFATSIAGNEVSRVIYRDFLPKALTAGSYKAASPHR